VLRLRTCAAAKSRGFADFGGQMSKLRERVEADHGRIVQRSKALLASRRAKLNELLKSADAIAREDVKFVQDLVSSPPPQRGAG
jgi:D-alanyl-D-alanine dipeptidase